MEAKKPIQIIKYSTFFNEHVKFVLNHTKLSTFTFMKEEEINRIIEMAWEDRTPFEAITFQFGISEAETIKIMRQNLKRSSFNLWRKRVNSGVSQKHLSKRLADIKRFKCSLQRTITFNKISKR